MMFILIVYVDEWNDSSTASETLWLTWLVNVLLASGVNVHRLRLCWKRTFWAHAVVKMMWCNTYDFLRDNKCYWCRYSVNHFWADTKCYEWDETEMTEIEMKSNMLLTYKKIETDD